ncbi:PAS domain-containing protein [Hymenobacter fastidiosus]|uniref:histidine kinase n=1 Tax=Hymenobacter fastidiosus TaxID=486264 RepID=A0ABP7SM07_9BACT
MPAEAVDFDLIFDALLAPHLVLAPDLTVVAANVGICQLLHCSREALLGRPALAIFDQLPATPLAAWQTTLAAAVQQQQIQTLHLVLAAPDGGPEAYHHWQIQLRPVPDTGAALRYLLCRMLDVTEQVRAEQQGQSNQEGFGLLARATHDAIWDADLRTGTVWRNAMFNTLFGYPATADTQAPAFWHERVHPDDRTRVEAAQARAIAAPDTVVDVEYRFRRADGEWAEVVDRAYVVRDAQGQATRLLGAMQDVTRQRAAERLARQNADRFQHLTEVQQQLVWTAGADGDPEYVNPYLEKYLGLDLAGVRDWGWEAVAHPDDFPRAREQRRETLRTGQPFETELRLREQATGRYRWFLGRVVPIHDEAGTVTQWVGTATDIDAHKRAEQHLQQSNEQFRLLLETLPQMAWTSEPTGGVTYYNQRWYDFTGGTFAELQDWGWERFIHPDDLAATSRRWKHSLAQGTAFEAEHRWRNRRGEYRWFLGRAEPIRDEQNQIVLWVGTNTDIHDSRQLRQHIEEKDQLLQLILSQMPADIATLAGPDHRITFINHGMNRLYGRRAVPGLSAAEAFPEVAEQGFVALMDQVYSTGQPYYGVEQLTLIPNAQTGVPETHYLDFSYQPLRDEADAVQGLLVFAVDATERVLARRRAQELDATVRQRDEQMRIMSESLPQITCISNALGEPHYLSPQWYAYTGQNPDGSEASLWREVCHPTDGATCWASFQEARQARRTWSGQLRLRRHDGQYRWHLSQAVPMPNEQGVITHWYGSTTDIHEQWEIQETLRWSQERYELAALATNDAIWDWTLATGQLTWNAAIERVFGYPASVMEVPLAWWENHIHPADVQRVLAGIQQVLAGRLTDWQAEYRFQRADGSYAQVLDRGHIAYNDQQQPTRMIGAMQDVTQQRTAENALREREAEFTTLANMMPQLAWMAGPDGHIFWYNQQWYDYTGTTLETMQGGGWHQLYHPDHLPGIVEGWTAALASGERWNDTFPLRSRQGEYRWFLSRAQPVRDEQGQVVRWFGTNTDVTEAQRVEQQLKQQNAELLRINEDLDNFVYTASHDLKQPINNMAGIFEELTRTAFFRDPDAIKLTAMFERALQQIYSTIYNLSELVQVQKLRHELPTEVLTLELLTQEVVASIGEQLSAMRAVVTTDFTAAPSVAFVRPNLQSVLYNLISNALKYAAPTRPPAIHVRSYREDEFVVVAVQDNGVGIDLERYGSQLFQMFRRFHDHVPGSGMGLYLVNRVVQSYGGRVDVESVVGQGTTFRVYIPRQGPSSAGPAGQEVFLG